VLLFLLAVFEELSIGLDVKVRGVVLEGESAKVFQLIKPLVFCLNPGRIVLNNGNEATICTVVVWIGIDEFVQADYLQINQLVAKVGQEQLEETIAVHPAVVVSKKSAQHPPYKGHLSEVDGFESGRRRSLFD
jgi:hypothetical protein